MIGILETYKTIKTKLPLHFCIHNGLTIIIEQLNWGLSSLPIGRRGKIM